MFETWYAIDRMGVDNVSEISDNGGCIHKLGPHIDRGSRNRSTQILWTDNNIFWLCSRSRRDRCHIAIFSLPVCWPPWLNSGVHSSVAIIGDDACCAGVIEYTHRQDYRSMDRPSSYSYCNVVLLRHGNLHTFVRLCRSDVRQACTSPNNQ